MHRFLLKLFPAGFVLRTQILLIIFFSCLSLSDIINLMTYSKRELFNTTNTEDMIFKKIANNFTIMATIKIKVRADF